MRDGKIDFSSLYFHGLHFLENTEYLERMTLDKILKHGKIAPKNELLEILTKEEYSTLFQNKLDFNFNGMDCVSVAQRCDTYNEWNKRYVIYSDRAFNLFCTRGISIMISHKINFHYKCYGEYLLHNNRENLFMNGEIQVKGAITKEYFEGISYYQYYTNSFIEELIKTDSKNVVKDDLLKLSESDFVEKYFSKQIMIEELLNKYGYNIGIFDIETGEQVPSIEEEKENIYTLKNCI